MTCSLITLTDNIDNDMYKYKFIDRSKGPAMSLDDVIIYLKGSKFETARKTDSINAYYVTKQFHYGTYRLYVSSIHPIATQILIFRRRN